MRISDWSSDVCSSDLKAGRSKWDAIMTASGIRLRPILMTTAAMVLSVVPLVIATGAGAVGRNHMGLVIFTGISIGTLFTLFVAPAMRSEEHTSELQSLMRISYAVFLLKTK